MSDEEKEVEDPPAMDEPSPEISEGDIEAEPLNEVPSDTPPHEVSKPPSMTGVVSRSGEISSGQRRPSDQLPTSPRSTPAPALSVGILTDDLTTEESPRASTSKGILISARVSVSVTKSISRCSQNLCSGQPQLARILYKAAAPVIQNPLKPRKTCKRPVKSISSNLPGADKPVSTLERNYYSQYLSPPTVRSLNPAAAAPMRARPSRLQRFSKEVARGAGSHELGWAEKEERIKDYRDHLLAQEIGYETLVGNLMYIDIPGGRDIQRSWENFLSQDEMEWGFPYYKGSKDRPKFKHKEPYLAFQLKEKLWRYPKTRIYHSTPEE